MPYHTDSGCKCPRGGYSAFDSLCAAELRLPITAADIINKSQFCISFQLDQFDRWVRETLTLRDYLYGLRNRMGVYHIWYEDEFCWEHHLYSMEAMYVGKGIALSRVSDHAERKDLRPDERIGVSFFECENRVAKYLEQLFLDTYDFEMNKNECRGTETLYACWDEDRRINGTELHNISMRPNAPTRG
jgi:hypothetical protein